MTVTTSGLWAGDSKHILWNMLKDEFASLQTVYPTKISVLVLKQYPKTVEQLDKYSAVITVARISTPQEQLFLGDTFGSGLSTDELTWTRQKGAFNTDYYEIGIWSFDPDYRDQMYYIVRQLMFEKRQYLLEQGFVKVIRTGGGDQEVDLIAQPKIIYRATQVYMITAKTSIDSTADLISEMDITQTIRVQLSSSTNEKDEIKIIP